MNANMTGVNLDGKMIHVTIYTSTMDPMGNMTGGYFPWTPAASSASGASGTSPRLGEGADLQGVDRWESGWFCIEMMDWFKGKSKPETIDFPMKYGAFRFQFSLKPIH